MCLPNVSQSLNAVICALMANLNINPNLSTGVVEKVPNYHPKEERREGGGKKVFIRAHGGWDSNPGTTTSYARVPSCTPQGLFRQASLSMPIDRLGRLCSTMCMLGLEITFESYIKKCHGRCVTAAIDYNFILYDSFELQLV